MDPKSVGHYRYGPGAVSGRMTVSQLAWLLSAAAVIAATVALIRSFA
jgi:hypothetical protein